jgi:hypothetical protein
MKSFQEKAENAKQMQIRVDGDVPYTQILSVDNARIYIPSHCHTGH